MQEQDRHIAVWNNCLQIIGANIDPQKFDTWFRPIRPVSLVDSTLTLEVPSDFFREYLEGAFLHLLKAALKREIGTDAKLNYMVRPVRNQQPMTFPAADTTNPVNPSVAINTFKPGNPGPFVLPGIRRVQINPNLKAEYCFANLIQGECNKMGYIAGENISLSPGKTSFNPFFLFGGPGLGKTHLAQAIGIAIKEKFPELIVLYLTGNDFRTQYMDAIRGNKLTEFMAFYMKIDVLIVDDIHQLQGQASQNAFFNVFNHLHQSGKQLIFTSDRAPVDLKNFEERLLSRFKWGLSVELLRPDFATRLAMLKAKAFREGVPIHDDILNFIATRVKTNFRELEGTLISLIAQATLLKKEITMELAEKVTSNLVGEEETEISIDKIVDTVCDYFNITRDDILSKSRKRPIVQARQIAMYECRNLIPSCSLATIGSELGGRDHATVLYACTTVQDLMTTDRDTKKYVSDIENMLSVPVEA
ncbi:MAG: chromosomal replication initiator protein DnaA [Bacteroidales bacterium]|nr:chromosomal replication initiator protein DnaA [Bacteroidales bacterium]MBQ2551050.1 chromosomal replication initiator protein DnaA [Bacteroidales bacterium]